jgi:uncharacterized membrane protein YheB (UPF0754 family)
VTGLATAAGDISSHWYVYASMPVFAALIGWLTKLMLIRMLFAPIEFVGVGPIGWQGIIPRRAAKFASMAADTLLDELIDPREMLDRIDPDQLITELEQPMLEVIDDLVKEITARYPPALWDSMPESARRLVVSRVRQRSRQALENLLADVRTDLDQAFDVRYIAISNMVRNKELMNQLVREIATPEFKFMIRMGIIFGAAIGVVQAITWALFHNHLIIPLFGGLVGWVTDYLALKMIFSPRTPTRYLGVFRWQGMFFKRREAISAAYARVGARDLLDPRMLIDSLLQGPIADRLFAIVARETGSAIDAEVGVARPLVALAIGTEQYRNLKQTIVERARARLPDVADDLVRYTHETMDTETTVRDAMMSMNDEQYEGLLRPIFKDDEWMIIAVGAVLGFLVGELQVLLLTHL